MSSPWIVSHLSIWLHVVAFQKHKSTDGRTRLYEYTYQLFERTTPQIVSNCSIWLYGATSQWIVSLSLYDMCNDSENNSLDCITDRYKYMSHSFIHHKCKPLIVRLVSMITNHSKELGQWLVHLCVWLHAWTACQCHHTSPPTQSLDCLTRQYDCSPFKRTSY